MAVGPMAATLDPEAVAAFMQQLGIHPAETDDFGWIAEVGLRSPLPPRWTSHTDSSTGYIYYIDHDRQVSEWENPLVPYLRRVVEIGRGYLQSEEREGYFEEQKGLLWHQHKQDLECWHGPFPDAEGRHYFVNSIAGVSSWQDPRIDAQYMFELESGLLTTLQEVLPPPSPNTPGFGDHPGKWNTAEGAEVLTLDVSPTTKRTRPYTGMSVLGRLATGDVSPGSPHVAMLAMGLERRSLAEKMSTAAEQVEAAQKDEEEVQKLQILKKAEERKRRLKKAAAVAAAAAAGGCEAPPAEAASSSNPSAPQRYSLTVLDVASLANEPPPVSAQVSKRESLLSGKLSPSNEEQLLGPPRELFVGNNNTVASNSRLPPIPVGAIPPLPPHSDASPHQQADQHQQPIDLTECDSGTLS
mmetsp:Transcript_13102/g.30611  ORF Transcript_13102/g.30611 Transcript_13102/m.30611 type:complete len:412 (+) Transcript_13102:61-1296(+)